MAKRETTEIGGLGFVEALTLLFIGLKFTGYITWTWLWVLRPLWITVSVCAVLAGLALLLEYVQGVLREEHEDE